MYMSFRIDGRLILNYYLNQISKGISRQRSGKAQSEKDSHTKYLYNFLIKSKHHI